MGNGNWFRRGSRRAKSGVQQPGQSAKRKGWLSSAANRCALSFEALEDRHLLATFLVTNTFDVDGGGATIFGSLRWAVGQANATAAGDTIVFSENLFNLGGSSVSRTIALNGGVLNITQPLDILGPGPRKLAIAQGTAESRVFDINIGSDIQVRSVEISGVTITGGRAVGDDEAGKGGGIFNREALTMNEVVIQANSAQTGGGGVYTAFGGLTLNRSLVINNSGGGDGGGGILNGRPEAMNAPTTNIINSTIADNSAGRWGGGVLNRNGRLNIEHATITENVAGDLGAGVASYGNGVAAAPTMPPTVPPPDHPDPTVFTEVYGSIIFGNFGTDFDRVGETTDDPPRRLNPSVVSLGYNIVGTGNTTVPDMDPPIPPMTDPLDDFAFDESTDQVITDPAIKVFRHDEDDMPLGRQDFGGSTDVYLLDDTSPAIDAGDEFYFGEYEQRGRHFTRIYDYDGDETAIVDIGAVEMQLGVFVVDTLIDEDDYSFSGVYTLEFEAGVPIFTIGGYEEPGDFSLREAIDFATKNPGLDTILFSSNLNSVELVDDEDLNASPAPTIILSPFLGSFVIDEDLVIQGPEGFILEIDGVGLDTDPNTQNGTGSRVFEIDDGDSSLLSTVTMSNLTIMGGDVISQGGGIRSSEDLVLTQMTFKGNNATDDGGALWVFGGAIVTIDRSTFNNNRAGDNGGAIYATGGVELTVTNSTISSNFAGNRGAGIYSNNSIVLVEYSTITLNNASSTLGSGIGAAGSTATVDVKSTIISGNVSNDVDFFGSSASDAFVSLGYNLIGRGTASGAFTQTGDRRNVNNPMLEALAVTGGLVATHAPVYRPDQGLVSPVIDMGDPAAEAGLGGVPDYDQRGPGFTRVFAVLSSSVRIDIGAYELQGSVFEVSSLIDENDGVVSPGNMSLREAIALANLNPLFDVITFDADITDTFDPMIRLGLGVLAPGTPADIRITSSMKIDWQGDSQLLINGFNLDNPSASIEGSRMFTVDDGDLAKKIDVEFSGGDEGVIVFMNARSSQGGGVFYSRENLTFNDVTFFGNQTYDPNEVAAGFPDVDQTNLHGGALYQDGIGQAVKPTLTLERVLFTGNSTNDVNADGGAIYVVDAALVLDDSTVTGNSTTMADSDGGAIALKNSTLLSQSFTSITGNIIQSGAGDGGGVYFSDGSVVTLLDTVVSGNNTTGGNSVGGGLAGVNSQLIVDSSIISENFTLGTQSSGGGIAMTGGSAVIDASTLRANVANGNNSHGGGIWNNGGLLTVRGSSVIDNDATHASGKGGGVYSDTNLAGTQSTLIVNSTISGNSAAMRGGGVFNADGRTDIRNSTITNNSTTAASAGGGVASFGNVALTVTSVQNSIVAGNGGTDVSFVDGVSGNSFQSLGYNVIGGGNALGTFSQAGDQAGVLAPGLGALADNGRPIGVAFEMLTHALLAGSVAINGGDPAFNTASLPEDQLGAKRKQKGRIDIGALESDFAPPGFADFDGDSDVDGSDFLTWQRNLGRTSATLAQGDANGDGSVNGADLTAWRNTFGSGSAVSAAAASSSGTALASVGVESASAESEPSTVGDDFGSLASLGVPGSSASSDKVSESQETFEAATEASSAPDLAWDSGDGDSLLDDEGDFDLLVASAEGESDGAAEDAVFAAWGVGRVF